MVDIDIKYNPVIDFLFSIVRINLKEVIYKHKEVSKYEDKDGNEIESYVNDVYSDLSSMMREDFDTFTKKFSGGLQTLIYLAIKHNITSINSFFHFIEKLTGEDFFDAYDEMNGINRKLLSPSEYEEALKTNIRDSNTPDNYKVFVELKKHKDETRVRLLNFLNIYYSRYYRSVEERTNEFMKQRLLFYKSLKPENRSYLLNKMLLIDVTTLDPKWNNIVLYPSYFYEIGMNQFRVEDKLVYVFGYMYEQQVSSSFSKTRIDEFRKILADDKRVEILQLLNRRRYYSTEIAEILKVSKPTISYHIYKLLSVGLLNMEFETSKKVYFSLNKEALREIMEDLYKEIVEGNSDIPEAD